MSFDDRLTYAAHDISIPRTTRDDLKMLSSEALERILIGRRKVVDTYVERAWFPEIIAEARSKVQEIEDLLKEKRLKSVETKATPTMGGF